LATVSPNGDGFRDAAHVTFALSAPATVELDVLQTDTLRREGASTRVVQRVRRSLPQGRGELVWRPAPTTPPPTDVLELVVTAAAHVDWSAHRDAPAPIRVVRPGDWPSGLYFLRVTADDGRVGYAPVVVRPRTLGQHRVAVVLATRTWQAYNFADANGDGWGDSWYVS